MKEARRFCRAFVLCGRHAPADRQAADHLDKCRLVICEPMALNTTVSWSAFCTS
jgi:hypothetical protein